MQDELGCVRFVRLGRLVPIDCHRGDRPQKGLFSDGYAGPCGVLAMLRGPLVPRRFAIATMTRLRHAFTSRFFA
jgi:hypothetical protein